MRKLISFELELTSSKDEIKKFFLLPEIDRFGIR